MITPTPQAPTDLQTGDIQEQNPKRTVATVWILAAVSILIALIVYPHLPDPMPTHWGLEGKPNGWSPRWFGAALIPGMIILFAILFPILERIDPKRNQYALFRKPYAAIQIALAAFFVYIESLMFYAAMVPAHNDIIGPGITVAMGVLFIILGNYMGKIRQNWFIGLRTPWTLEDPEIWNKSQRLAGWMFVLGGIAILITGLTVHSQIALFVLMMSTVVLISFVPLIYSYVLAMKKRGRVTKS